MGTLGVFSYVVHDRTREIGVRMVLGARARDIVRMLVARLSWPLASGVAIGLLCAQALGGVLGSRLYGLSPRDPIAYLVVLVVLTSATTAAIWIPARRALCVDPAVTLRTE